VWRLPLSQCKKENVEQTEATATQYRLGRVALLSGAVLLAVAIPRGAMADPGDLTDETRPSPLAGGEEVEACGWPTTVAITGGNSLCTGTLVHPEVVTFAAHCLADDKQIKFGQSSTTPAHRVEPRFCRTNPDYLGTSDSAHDWAFCVLDEPVTDLPITPPLLGCEEEELFVGREVAIVGFGNDTASGGSGTKRWAMAPIVSMFGNTVAIGGDGVGTCSGDSGGSAFVQLDDGTWRAFSIVSTGVVGECGPAGTSALLKGALEWIESEADIDITPCHDLDGTWNPNPTCAGFFAGGATGYGTWSDWCDGTPQGSASTTCGDPYDAVDDTEAPQVSITAPDDGTVYEDVPATVTVSIDADDGDGWGVKGVRIEINGAEQPLADGHEPFEFVDVQFPQGVYSLVAIAEDWAGNIERSTTVRIGVGEEIPEDPDTGTTGGGNTTGGGTHSGGTTTSGDSGGSQDTDTAEPSGREDGGGCSCRSQGAERSLALAWLCLARLARRRRTSTCQEC
jgi:hypothetical protein